MATEVEMKARVDDFAEMDRRISELCAFEREYSKRDIYLRGPGGKFDDGWAHWRPDGYNPARSPQSTAGDDSGTAQSDVPRRTQDFRVRIDGDEATCTFKDRQLVRGVERNREVEFSLSDVPAFLELVDRLGCRLYNCKIKEGKRYRFTRDDGRYLTVELSRIAGLGIFLEVECLIDEEDEAQRQQADAAVEIREFLTRVGVSDNDVEDTPYSKLMADNGVDHCNRISELRHLLHTG